MLDIGPHHEPAERPFGLSADRDPVAAASHEDASGRAAIVNRQIAARLEEMASLLRDQGADPHRVAAYRRAAASVRLASEPLDRMFMSGGLERLQEIPGVGPSIARAVRELLIHKRLPMLERLRGQSDPISLLTSIPGIGRVSAHTLHEELGLETLADLEAAAHDGRLETIAGFGPKRLAGIRESLAQRLGRVQLPAARALRPPVDELLDVDREYREKAAAGELSRIAPRRFNPGQQAWLPVLHTHRGAVRYTALFSNTAHAHRAGKTADWVVLYADDGHAEGQFTALTAAYGPLRGQRVIAGREDECAETDARRHGRLRSEPEPRLFA